mgnify:CR=1 FL=1
MSALVDKLYTLDNLVTFNSDGLTIASFVDIKKTLINRMRQLYGNDIDVTDASVDGQWITELALLINTLLQALNNLYANMNPAVAEGYALDVLASFSNIKRKPAQASICNIKLHKDQAFDLGVNTEFVDKNGQIWKIDNSREDYLPIPSSNMYHFSQDEMIAGVIVPLICTITGPIEIPAQTIEGFVDITSANSDVTVYQENDGIKGSIEESDAHLRARRNQSEANESVTVIDGIIGTLLANENIDDACIQNDVNNHQIMPIIKRRFENTSSPYELDYIDKFIANTIFNKLTPGIPSKFIGTTVGSITTSVVERTFEETTRFAGITKTVKWAEAVPIKPTLKITLHKYANFDEVSSCNSVITAIAKYANELGLLIDLDASTLLQKIIYADPQFQGRATFWCAPSDITIETAASTFTMFTFNPATSAYANTTSAKAKYTCYKYSEVIDQNDHKQNSDSSIQIIIA